MACMLYLTYHVFTGRDTTSHSMLYQLFHWLFLQINCEKITQHQPIDTRQTLNIQLIDNNVSVTLAEILQPWSSAEQPEGGWSVGPMADCLFLAFLPCQTPLGALEVSLYN